MDNHDKKFKVAIICSFSEDEPLDEILDAAAELPNVRFYVTGDKSKANTKVLNSVMTNVEFTGFLDYERYVSTLRYVDAVLVLTKRDRTMLAGAYDALAIQKPLITSNWEPLKRYFSRGTIHVDNSSRQIEAAIRIVQRNKEKLEREINELKLHKILEWEKKFGAFEQLLMEDYNMDKDHRTDSVGIITADQ
jgi:hypothetical protein